LPDRGYYCIRQQFNNKFVSREDKVVGGKYQSAGFSNAHYNQFKINKNVNAEQFTM